jgi:phage/plasmid-like protein (TIGR03299 family)
MKELLQKQVKNMAHNLEITTEGASFFTVRELAWHKLGKVFEERLTTQEAIVAANMNYEVGIVPNYAEIPTNDDGIKYKRTPNSFATYRKDNNTVFGAVGGRYEVVQNWEAFDFLDSIISERAAIYETGGVLGVGETIFITAKLPEQMILSDSEAIENYLLFTMSHDGTSSIQVLFTPVRVVCNNTLTLALSQTKNVYRMNHTKNIRERMEHAANIIRDANIYVEELKKRLAFAMTKHITEMCFRHLLHTLFNSRYRANNFEHNVDLASTVPVFQQVFTKVSILELFASARCRNLIEDIVKYAYGHHTQRMPGLMDSSGLLTGYGAINGITGYFQNHATFKNDTDKFQSLLSGKEEGQYARLSKIGFLISKYYI